MTVRYVGAGGSDAANGLTWATRKATLNGVEDSPVAAGDIVYAGPGVYRETLTLDVSGTLENPIVYVADVTGAFTDGIGGVVRLTGSDNDQTATRNNNITAFNKSFRTFRGFVFDSSVQRAVDAAFMPDLTLEDCAFMHHSDMVINAPTAAASKLLVRRCVFIGNKGALYNCQPGAEVNVNHIIENCLMIGSREGYGLYTVRAADIIIRHCTFYDFTLAVYAAIALTGTITVNNCIFANNGVAMQAAASGDIVEDYNTFHNNVTDRTNVATGSNSNAFIPLFEMPLLISGHDHFQWNPFRLSEWSPLRRIAGTGEALLDLHGLDRGAVTGQRSRGAIQFQDVIRDTAVKRSGTSAAKIVTASSMRMIVPHDGTQKTLSAWLRKESGYAGSVPQMIIKQPGQSDIVVNMSAVADEVWSQVQHTWTPAAAPGYVIVEFKNRHNTTTPKAVWVDDVAVT